MGRKKLNEEIIERIGELRRKGYSLPEISEGLSVPKTTAFRYIRGVEISHEYLSQWAGKRGGSKKRKLILEKKALEEGVELIQDLTHKEKLLFLCALYWAEGNKKDLILTNTDPELIRIFVNGLRELLGISNDRLKISLRIFSDLDLDSCLNYWSNIVEIPKESFSTTSIREGKKKGKLQYGMCRVRVLKGGGILKQIQGINKAFVQAFAKAGRI